MSRTEERKGVRGLSPWDGGDRVARGSRGVYKNPTELPGGICSTQKQKRTALAKSESLTPLTKVVAGGFVGGQFDERNRVI